MTLVLIEGTALQPVAPLADRNGAQQENAQRRRESPCRQRRWRTGGRAADGQGKPAGLRRGRSVPGNGRTARPSGGGRPALPGRPPCRGWALPCAAPPSRSRTPTARTSGRPPGRSSRRSRSPRHPRARRRCRRQWRRPAPFQRDNVVDQLVLGLFLHFFPPIRPGFSGSTGGYAARSAVHISANDRAWGEHVRRGCTEIFSSCSPDLNPIEMLFAKIKKVVRSAEPRCFKMLCQTINTALLAAPKQNIKSTHKFPGMHQLERG